MLRHHGIKPILVFDGGHLPMKSEQENKRARYPNLISSAGNWTFAYFLFLCLVKASASLGPTHLISFCIE